MRVSVVLAFLAAAPSAWATTAVPATLSELVADSDVVVLGSVGVSTSYWEGGRILTRVPVFVDEVWAGQATESVLEVVTLGGEVDGIGQRVSGALRVTLGERIVLCLQRRDGEMRPVHMSQGAFFVLDETAADPEETAADPRIRRRSFGLKLLGYSATAMPTTLRTLERAVREVDRAHR
jgi:hypothetical protein